MSTSDGPIGTGESIHPKEGNAILYTVDLDGSEVANYLWIDSFNSDLNMEINASQVKRGLSYRPIRIQERVLTFNTLWNVAKRADYLKLLDNIKAHWAANLNDLTPTPCRLNYFGANKVWKGFILNASQSYAITDVVLRYTFNMKLITNINQDNASASGLAPFMPTLADGTDFGSEWYTTGELEQSIKDTFNGTPAQEDTPPLAGAGTKFVFRPGMDNFPGWV